MFTHFPKHTRISESSISYNVISAVQSFRSNVVFVETGIHNRSRQILAKTNNAVILFIETSFYFLLANLRECIENQKPIGVCLDFQFFGYVEMKFKDFLKFFFEIFSFETFLVNGFQRVRCFAHGRDNDDFVFWETFQNIAHVSHCFGISNRSSPEFVHCYLCHAASLICSVNKYPFNHSAEKVALYFL